LLKANLQEDQLLCNSLWDPAKGYQPSASCSGRLCLRRRGYSPGSLPASSPYESREGSAPACLRCYCSGGSASTPRRGAHRPSNVAPSPKRPGVRDRPLLERAGFPAREFLHRRVDLLLVQRTLDVEAEERVDVFGWHGVFHLGPGLGVGLALEFQVPTEHGGQNPDLVGG
jgi:hypothetical protein